MFACFYRLSNSRQDALVQTDWLCFALFANQERGLLLSVERYLSHCL